MIEQTAPALPTEAPPQILVDLPSQLATGNGKPLTPVRVTWGQASEFVAYHHRHLPRVVGGKFWLGVATRDRVLRGVVIVGRPVARSYDDGRTLEVTRVATDGTKNACSVLYAAARRATFALLYDRLITYTQEGESGASLRGAGWQVLAQRPPRPGWDVPSRPRESRGVDGVQRTLWEAA